MRSCSQFTEPVFVILPDVADLSQKAGAGFGVCLRGSLLQDSLLLLYVAGCRSHGGESACDSQDFAYALVMMRRNSAARTLNRRFWCPAR